MVLVLDPLQEKVSCPLTARSELDSPSSDVIPRYRTHSDSSASACTHVPQDCSRLSSLEQEDEIPGGSDTVAEAQEKAVEPNPSTSNGEDALDGAVISVQRRCAVRKQFEDGVLKQKVTHDD